MARIKKWEATEREAFMINAFKQNPEMSAAQANNMLHSKHGAKMRMQRVYELRALVRNEIGDGALKSSTPPATAGRRQRKLVRATRKTGLRVSNAARYNPELVTEHKKVSAPVVVGTEQRNKLVVVEGNGEQISWLKSVLKAMRDGGISNVIVDHSSGTYAVLKA